MSVVSATDRRRDVSIAFDEACDAVAEGRPDDAQKILDRAMPKPQARHILEAILTHHKALAPSRFGLSPLLDL